MAILSVKYDACFALAVREPNPGSWASEGEERAAVTRLSGKLAGIGPLWSRALLGRLP